MNSDDHTIADFARSDFGRLLESAAEFKDFIDDWKRKGTYTYRQPLVSTSANTAEVRAVKGSSARSMVMLGSNNYLGINARPEVIEAACRAIRQYGTSMCSAPFLSGTFELLLLLESRIAAFERCEAAMVFSTGYQANVGTITALLHPSDTAVIDKLAHASVVDGCRMAGCSIKSFRHNDPDSLDAMLRRTRRTHRGGILVIVEGVFSMDGDMSPLPEIVAAAKRHEAVVMVDEAHATGVVGPTGRGSVEHFGLHDQVDIVLGTFSKTLASAGGFIAGSDSVVNYVRHYARSYVFSASPTPANCGAALAALDIVEREPELRERLWDNVRYMHSNLQSRGFRIIPDTPQSGIIGVVIGDETKMRALSKAIYERNVYVNPVIYPAVARDSCRYRISLSALHERTDLDYALDVLESVCRENGLI